MMIGLGCGILMNLDCPFMVAFFVRNRQSGAAAKIRLGCHRLSKCSLVRNQNGIAAGTIDLERIRIIFGAMLRAT